MDRWLGSRVPPHSGAVEFSHHLEDLEVTNVLMHYWELARFFVSGHMDESGIKHLIVCIVANLLRDV